MPTKPMPFELIIPEPCGESWEAMGAGGPMRRHCERCQTDVVDVSLLTGAELRTLVERTGGDFCARVTRLPDGAMMLREPPPASAVLSASLLRAPVLAGAMLAGTALQLAAQSQAPLSARSEAGVSTAPEARQGTRNGSRQGTHAGVPTLSCAEVTALRQGGGLAGDGVIVTQAPAAAAPAPAPPPQDGREAHTMGKPAIPLVPIRGTVRLPRGHTVRNGLVEAYTTRGYSKSMEVRPDGSFAGALPRGKYFLRAEVRGDNAELYATVNEITVGSQAFTHDMTLEGPVMVTAGAPMPVPSPGQSQRR